MKVICFGDSLTFGYGVNPDKCWVRRFAALTGARTVNLGVNGDTTAYILQRIKAYIGQGEVEKGDAVFICGGENDVLMYGASMYDVQNMVSACGYVRDAGAEPFVIIQPGFVPSDYPFYGDMDLEYINRNHDNYASALLEKCAELGINHTDLRKVIAGRRELYIDGVHLTEEGHRLCATDITTRFKTIYGPFSST